jgi:hypothetical protein
MGAQDYMVGSALIKLPAALGRGASAQRSRRRPTGLTLLRLKANHMLPIRTISRNKK